MEPVVTVSDAAMAVSAPDDAAREFEAWFQSHYVRLARLVYRVVGDRDRAEEIAAEAFWRLHRTPLRRNDNPPGWLCRTALRLALDVLKKERRRARYEALAGLFGAAANPEHLAQQSEDRRRVRQVLAALKPSHASVLLLRSDGCSYADIASALRVKSGSVGTLLARAEAAFRKEYVKRHGKQ